MSEAAANSKEKNEIKVSKTILPENKKYESASLNYQIKIPDWLLKDIHNFEKTFFLKFSFQNSYSLFYIVIFNVYFNKSSFVLVKTDGVVNMRKCNCLY